MRSTWTDERLDDLKTDLNGRIDGLSGRVDVLSSRVDAIQHTMVQGFVVMMATLVTGFLGLAGVIITKL